MVSTMPQKIVISREKSSTLREQKMTSLASYKNKSSFFLTNPIQSIRSCMDCCYYDLILKINPFFIQTLYFISVSFLGLGILEVLKPRTEAKPRNIDLLFTSVSAATVSSISTVEMEVFSNEQLIVITILMFIGGEVFTSMVGLHLKRFNISKTWKNGEKNMDPVENDPFSLMRPTSYFDHIVIVTDLSQNNGDTNSNNKSSSLEYDSNKFLGYLVLGYY